MRPVKIGLCLPARGRYGLSAGIAFGRMVVGPFGNPEEGAMGIFRTREAAEEFVEWNKALSRAGEFARDHELPGRRNCGCGSAL